MKTPWILAAAVGLTGQVASGAAQAQDGEARLSRLWQHRSIIEQALEGPGPAPIIPQARALQPMPEQAPLQQALAAPPQQALTPQAVAEEPGEVSCEAAAGIVEDYGFSEVRTADCSGETYSFSAMRDGTAYSIAITAAAGEIAEVSRD